MCNFLRIPGLVAGVAGFFKDSLYVRKRSCKKALTRHTRHQFHQRFKIVTNAQSFAHSRTTNALICWKLRLSRRPSDTLFFTYESNPRFFAYSSHDFHKTLALSGKAWTDFCSTRFATQPANPYPPRYSALAFYHPA